MNALATRYSTTLVPLLIAVAGVFVTASQSATSSLLSWQVLTQAVILVVSTGTDFWLPLVNSRWRGAAKTGASIVFVIASTAIAVVPEGPVTRASLLLIAAAVLKALGTEVGTWIRTDAARAADPSVDEDPEITELPSIEDDDVELEPLPAPDELAPTDALDHGDGLANPDNPGRHEAI